MTINDVRDKVRALSNPEGINQYTKGGGSKSKSERTPTEHVASIIKGHGSDSSTGLGTNFANVGEVKSLAEAEKIKSELHDALLSQGFTKGKTYTFAGDASGPHKTTQVDYHKGKDRVVVSHTASEAWGTPSGWHGDAGHTISAGKYGPRGGPDRKIPGVVEV